MTPPADTHSDGHTAIARTVPEQDDATGRRTTPVAQTAFFIVFWLWALYGFPSDEWFKDIQVLRPYLQLLLDLAMAAIAFAVVRRRRVWIAIGAFAAFTWAVSCLVNDLATSFWLNGMREFIGLLLAYPVVIEFCRDTEGRRRFSDALDFHMRIFLCIQAFCIIYQFLRYGAGDAGGGSFGHNYSGQVSMMIYLASFYIIRRRIAQCGSVLPALRSGWGYIALLLPTFLNETKVSFILLALYILLLVPIDRKMLIRLTVILPLVGAVSWLGFELYTTAVRASDNAYEIKSAEDFVAYFMVEDIENTKGGALWDIENNGKADVPRLTKLMYLPLLEQQEPGHVALGFGVGHFKGGIIGESEFARNYDWLLMGSIPYLFHIYIQLGIVGIVLLMLYWIALLALRPQGRLSTEGNRRDVPLQIMIAASVLIIFFYNDTLRNLPMCMLLFSLLAVSWHGDDGVAAATEVTTEE